MSTIINRDKKIKTPKFDVASPAFAYPLFIIVFMLLGINGMTVLSASLFIVFIASFLAGFHFGRPGEKVRYPLVWRLGLPLFLVGAAAEFINIVYVDSIPLLVPTMRSRMIPALAYLSFLIVPACIIKISDCLLNKRDKEALIWLFSGTFLISLLGYRTEIYALLLGAGISTYYIRWNKIKRNTAIKYGAVFAFLFILLNLVVVLFREAPLGTVMDRFSFTTYVFSSLVDSMGISLFGHSGGLIHASILSSLRIIPGPTTGPRTFVSQLIGVGVGSTTPTIIGIPYLDYGIFGIILTGIILGLLFGSGYKMLKRGDVDILPVHALCTAFLLITVETGIADVIVLLYLIAYLVMIV